MDSVAHFQHKQKNSVLPPTQNKQMKDGESAYWNV